MLKLYIKNHLEKEYTSIGLFREIKKTFDPGRILYPGCYVHITPSLIFPDVTYIDSFRGTDKFFENPEVKNYINTNKEYAEDSRIVYYHQDYSKDLPEGLGSFDMIISQYAGFVGQAVKKYLKKVGY